MKRRLFVEYDIDIDVSGRVLRAYAVVGEQSYGSDHYLLTGGPLAPRVSEGGAHRHRAAAGHDACRGHRARHAGHRCDERHAV